MDVTPPIDRGNERFSELCSAAGAFCYWMGSEELSMGFYLCMDEMEFRKLCGSLETWDQGNPVGDIFLGELREIRMAERIVGEVLDICDSQW